MSFTISRAVWQQQMSHAMLLSFLIPISDVARSIIVAESARFHCSRLHYKAKYWLDMGRNSSPPTPFMFNFPTAHTNLASFTDTAPKNIAHKLRARMSSQIEIETCLGSSNSIMRYSAATFIFTSLSVLWALFTLRFGFHSNDETRFASTALEGKTTNSRRAEGKKMKFIMWGVVKLNSIALGNETFAQ